MSEYGIGRGDGEAASDVTDSPEEQLPIGDPGGDPSGDAAAEPVEEPVEEYADPQEWIRGLITALERAEQGIGSGPRDVLMARIKLAQAYSELGDTVQAAPLAVANVAQAQRLFPSSEGMLRQLREFRDAACEAAGWTAAMMRESAEDYEADGEDGFGRPSELVSRAAAVAAAAETTESATPYDPAEDFAAEREPVAAAASEGHQLLDPEPAGAVIHEFVRRPQEPDALQWAAEVQAALTQPAELAIPTPPEPEYAEEVEPGLAAGDLAELSDLADLAAIEEIIRLRYELREAQRTVERLRHVNRKLREALEYDEAP